MEELTTSEEAKELGQEISRLPMHLIVDVMRGLRHEFAMRGLEIAAQGGLGKTYEGFTKEEESFARVTNQFQVSELVNISEALSTVENFMVHYDKVKAMVYEAQDKAGYTKREEPGELKAERLIEMIASALEGCDCPACKGRSKAEEN